MIGSLLNLCILFYTFIGYFENMFILFTKQLRVYGTEDTKNACPRCILKGIERDKRKYRTTSFFY